MIGDALKNIRIPRQAGAKDSGRIGIGLARTLGRPVRLQLDQVLLDPTAGSADAQRAELDQTSDAAAADDVAAASVARLVALAAGASPDAVTIDRERRRAMATAAPLPGTGPATYRALEARVAATAPGWRIAIVPLLGPLPQIRFADNVDTLDPNARGAVLLSAWEARRWNIASLAAPGLPVGPPPAHPSPSQRRGLAIAALLRGQGTKVPPRPRPGKPSPSRRAPSRRDPR